MLAIANPETIWFLVVASLEVAPHLAPRICAQTGLVDRMALGGGIANHSTITRRITVVGIQSLPYEYFVKLPKVRFTDV